MFLKAEMFCRIPVILSRRRIFQQFTLVRSIWSGPPVAFATVFLVLGITQNFHFMLYWKHYFEDMKKMSTKLHTHIRILESSTIATATRGGMIVHKHYLL